MEIKLLYLFFNGQWVMLRT